ncbi:MAG TPA: hypothetical protein PLU13_02360 [Thermomonas sp.]|nr:hypothetical protein [Thermomonas sp.]
MKSRLSLAIATLAAGIGLAIGPVNVALAQNASQLGDLVGARAAGGESDLEARGYTFIQGGDAYGNAKQAYYWNGRNKACVRVETYDGRFRSITNADAAQCNQRSSKGSDDGKAAMAILGLAAIAAAAAHQDNQHSNASNNSAQWDIGYNDGLHGVPYHNVARSDGYSGGYDAGVRQRNQNTSYHSGRGGYAQAARFKDLQGTDATRAIDAMTERGFANVDTISETNTIYGIFYNRSTRQCIQLTMANSRVVSADDIQTHPNCR